MFKKIQKIVSTIVLIIISSIISLILLEYLVRIMFPFYDPNGRITYSINEEGTPLFPKNFDGRQWKNTGDYDVSIKTNQYGFRDNKDLALSTANDLFVVGDSFSFGHGVEVDKRYSNLLEKMLGLPVYNISVPTNFNGYDKLLVYAKKQGATIQNLILSVCMENDLMDYYAIAKHIPYERKTGHKTFNQYKRYLMMHSALYQVLTHMVHQNTALKTFAIKLGFIIENYQGMSKNTPSKIIIENSIKRLVEIINKHNILNVTILIIPSRGLWVGDNQQVEQTVHEQFIALGRQYNLKILDLKAVFEKNRMPLTYHFENDGHWNNQGHMKAAEAIYQFLTVKD